MCAGPTSTECETPDNRTTANHVVTSGTDQVAALITSLSGAAVAFTMPRTGTPTSLTLSLQRSDVTDAGASGSLRIRLIKGAPSLTPESSNIVATGFVPATNISTSLTRLTMTLPATLPTIATDQPLWIELTTAAEGCRFALFGTSSGSDSPVLESTATGYVRVSSSNAYLTLDIKACW